ncbi:hypothetical protein [[Kitasatospora] papulosa]
MVNYVPSPDEITAAQTPASGDLDHQVSVGEGAGAVALPISS